MVDNALTDFKHQNGNRTNKKEEKISNDQT